MTIAKRSVAPESESARTARWDLQRQWWIRLLAHPAATLHRSFRAGKLLMLTGEDAGCGYPACPGAMLNYWVWRDRCEVSLDLPDDMSGGTPNLPLSNLAHSPLDVLARRRDAIEAWFGGPLTWTAYSASSSILGGYGSSRKAWDEIIERQVDTMKRLHSALAPHARDVFR
jgi:hypothetical protein